MKGTRKSHRGQKPGKAAKQWMSLAVSPLLRTALDEAAAISGRTISAEAAHRLELALQREAQVDLTLAHLFGDQGGALMELLAYMAHGQGDWLSDAQAYANMRRRIDLLLDVVAPPSETQADESADADVEALLGKLFRTNPTAAWFRWAVGLQGRLGSDATRRIMRWLAGRQA
jgi:hypothetical protein